MNRSPIRHVPGIRWWIPVLLGGTVLWTVCRGLFVVREAGLLSCALETTVQRKSALDVLYPLYLEVSQESDRIGHGNRLEMPPPQVLDRDNLAGLSEMFRNMAAGYGIESSDIRLQVLTDNGQRFLQVALPLRGRYQHLGPMLADLIRLPYLVSVDRLSAVWHEDGDAIDVELKLALE